MASREFTDSEGVVWRVWDVTPAHLHPITRAEEYMEPWAGGWLAFESAREKRRLVAPYPSRWVEYDVAQLELLLKAAEAVGAKKKDTPKSAKLAVVEASVLEEQRAASERTFSSPRGRLWTVRQHECLNRDGSNEVVLRFTAGDIVVDLKDWPPDWKSYTRDQYALLLLDADPPRRTSDGTHPARRREDHGTD